MRPSSTPGTPSSLSHSASSMPLPAAIQLASDDSFNLDSEVQESQGSYGYVEWTPVWRDDDDVVACPLCSDEFGLFNRKHHCRGCGQVVCGTCSGHKITLKSMGYRSPVRVCNECYARKSNNSAPSLALSQSQNKIVASAQLGQAALVEGGVTGHQHPDGM
eukprot:TRINITY_DN6807_c0_g1_i5.p1 TRINITY_DN6807_c0_g1~~TRINITY_DN6807_c0_g1_i5.p1  ORF type:complete len:161 (-),score=14.52 TRINITY_DN6807_c0_g1_i5:41-523(-)